MVAFQAGRQPWQGRAGRAIMWSVFVLLMMLIPVVFGMLISLGVIIFDLVLIGVLVSTFLLFFPINPLIAIFLITVFVFTGLFSYFTGIPWVLWIPYLFGLVFYIRLPFELMRLRQQQNMLAPEYAVNGQIHTPIMIPFIAFVVILAASAIMNRPPVLQTFIGIRSYLFLWSLMFVTGFAITDEKVFERIWRFFVFFAFLQFPFVVFQAIYVVQIEGNPWDAISGTFGGYMTGEGGGSGSMILFLVLVFSYGLAMWRDGFWSGKRILFYIVALIGTVVLAEVKVALVLIPIVVLVILWRRIFYKPLQGILIVSGVGASIIGIFLIYSVAFWQPGLGIDQTYDWDSKMSRIYEYLLAMETDAGFVNLQNREVSRIGSVYIWIQEHRARYNVAETLIGHGPASSRVGMLMGSGTVAREYPFTLMTHSTSMLLWDVGFFGWLAFNFFFLIGAYRAYRLSKAEWVPKKARTRLSATSLMLALSIPLLLYNSASIDMPTQQTWIALLLGEVIFWDLYVRRKKRYELAQRRQNKEVNRIVGSSHLPLGIKEA